MRDNKSALESAVCFISSYEYYTIEQAKSIYNNLAKDKRVGNEKKQ